MNRGRSELEPVDRRDSDTAPESDAGPADSGRNRKRRGKKRKHRWIKWVVILAVVFAAVFVLRTMRRGNPTSQTVYQQDVAAKRNISTSYSYTGTVEAVDSQSVVSSVTGAKITEVDVELGDTVKEGDVICRLDTSDVDEQIAEKKATMQQTATSNALQLASAQQNYNDLQTNINDGLDSTLQNAQNSIDSAMAQLVSAEQAYNDEVTLNNEQLSSTIMSAIQQLQSAYDNVQSRALATQQANETKAQAQKEAEEKGMDFESLSYDQQIESAELAEEQAKTSYQEAQDSYEQAKLNEESNLTSLYDSLIQAQNSYLAAIDSYNAAVRSNEQKLKSYALQIQQAQASSDDSVNQMQLDQLEDSLDDYVVTAPMSGEITSLDVKVGDISQGSATSLATITNHDTMKVSISVSEYEISNLQVGESVTVAIDALDKSFDGTVSAVDAVGSSSSGIAYFNAEVTFVPDDDVMVGMTAEIDQTVTEASDVVTVQSSSIQTSTDGSSYVLVADNSGSGGYIQWPVTLGATDGTYTEIKSGLSEGETVYVAVQTAADSTDSSSSGLFGSLFGGGGGDAAAPSGGGTPPSGGPQGGGEMPSGGGAPPSGGPQ